MPTEREINTLYELSQADFQLYMTDRARGLVRVLLEEVMQAELTALLQAQPYERSAKRRGQRNGSYGRDLTTSLGRLEEVQVPRDRAGQFQPRVFEQYQRRQGEVDQAIQTMFIKGLSTTAVGQVVGPLLNDAPSPSTVSRIFHSLDEECAAWRQRPLDAHYRYIYLDGTYFTIGYEDEYEKTPILAAMGVKDNGERDVLGFMPGDKESRPAWDECLADLKGRGVVSAVGRPERPRSRQRRLVDHRWRARRDRRGRSQIPRGQAPTLRGAQNSEHSGAHAPEQAGGGAQRIESDLLPSGQSGQGATRGRSVYHQVAAHYPGRGAVFAQGPRGWPALL